MSVLHFAWDARKASINWKKHGVSFGEAETAFFDEQAIEFYDPDHSTVEDRFLMLGVSAHLRIIVVHYCYRQKNKVIRIISARKATQKEQTAYKERTYEK